MVISHQVLNCWVEFELVSTQKSQSKFLVNYDTTDDDDIYIQLIWIWSIRLYKYTALYYIGTHPGYLCPSVEDSGHRENRRIDLGDF